MFTATLIGDALAAGDIPAAADRLAAAGCAPGAGAWLEEGVAADLPFAADLGAARIALEGALDRKSTRLNSSHIQKSRMPSSA